MDNREKLKNLVMDVFLLEEKDFSFELTWEQVDSWDSLGMVALAVGIDQTFGYHMTVADSKVKGVREIIDLLETKGIHFGD
jgi:acyl carrier protein